MGSGSNQARLWGRQPHDWAAIQEITGNAGYAYALDYLRLKSTDSLLDIGCGSGLFCGLAAASGAAVTGLDATPQLIAEAKKREPSLAFLTGEMEELPFEEEYFEVVTGFNAFQYAADINKALREAHRVLKEGGRLVAMIWGNKDDCEAASFLQALGSLMPPQAPNTPGPFALTENHLLEKTLESAGFTILRNKDVASVWDYPDTGYALRGLMSTGPATSAILHSGEEKVRTSLAASMKPYIQPDGHVLYKNKFRVVVAEK
jgi:SAM-dependent methyltransferase